MVFSEEPFVEKKGATKAAEKKKESEKPDARRKQVDELTKAAKDLEDAVEDIQKDKE